MSVEIKLKSVSWSHSFFFLKNKVETETLYRNLSVHISKMIFFVILFYLRVAEETLNRVKRVVNGDEIEIAHWPWLVHLWVSVRQKYCI